MQLINNQTGQMEDLPQSAVGNAFISGTHNLPSGVPVPLLAPNGDVVNVAPEQVYDSLNKGGYAFPTEKHLNEAQMDAKYGDSFSNSAKAFGLGAARSATFGLSDAALVGLGATTPEALKELRERHGVATGAGEVAGVLGSLALAPEAEAADALGVKSLFNPIAIAEKGAKSVEQSVLDGFSGLGTETLAQKSLAKFASRTAGSAVLGAAYGTGQVVTEKALGDPDQVGQNILGHIGMSALLTAGIGNALGIAGDVIPPSVDKAKELLSSGYQALMGTSEDAGIIGKSFAKAASAVGGVPEEEVLNVWRNRFQFAKSPEEQVKVAQEFTSTLQEQHNAVKYAIKDAFKDIRPEETETLLDGANPQIAQSAFDKVANKIDFTVDKMTQEPEIYPPYYAKKLQQFRIRLGRGIGDASSAKDVFDAIDDFKSQLDTLIKYDRDLPPNLQDAMSDLKELRSTAKTTLENEEFFGPAAARQSSFNDAYNEYRTSQKDFIKKFAYKTSTNAGNVEYKIDPVKVNTFFNQASDPRGAIRQDILSRYTEAQKNLVNEIEKSYESLPDKKFDKESLARIFEANDDIESKAIDQAKFNSSVKKIGGVSGGGLGELIGPTVAGKVLGPAGVGAAATYDALRNSALTIQRLTKLESMSQKASNAIEKGAAAIFRGGNSVLEDTKGLIGSALAKEDRLNEFNETTNNVKEMASNPEKFLDVATKSTRPISSHAPNISNAMQLTAANAVSFLNSKIPSQPPKMPLSKTWMPSQTEITKFNRYYSAVNNPIEAMQKIKDGTLSKEHVEAIATVFPKMYDQMRSEILDKLTNHKSDIPYRTRGMLSLFLQQPLEESFNPQSIIMNQSVLNGPSLKNQENVATPRKPTQKGMENLSAADRILTPMQKSNERKE